MAEDSIYAEVAYATTEHQVLIPVKVANPSSVSETIVLSGLLSRFPDIDLANQKVGIFGQLVKLDQTVCNGDRIEVYRPLKIDPMDARRLKARTEKKPS